MRRKNAFAPLSYWPMVNQWGVNRNTLVTLGLAVGLALSGTFNGFAGQWVQEDKGWKYVEYDGTFIYTQKPEEKPKGDSEFFQHEVTFDPGKTGYVIDSDKDGYVENYYFDEEGYLFTDTIVDGFEGKKYRVNSDGAEIDDSGNVIKKAFVQGTIKPDLGKGVIKDKFINLLMQNLQTVDMHLGTNVKNRSYDTNSLVVRYEDGFNSSATILLMDDKAYSIHGWGTCVFNDTYMSVYKMDVILGVRHKKEVTDWKDVHAVTYEWVLQENPKVTMMLYEGSSYETRTVSIKVEQ